MTERKELPNNRTHRVVATIGVTGMELRAVGVQMRALAREYPGSVIVTDGPLWRPDVYVVAVPIEGQQR